MYCPGCGHHHRTRDTLCQAITHDEPEGGARRCNCPTPHTNSTGKDQPA